MTENKNYRTLVLVLLTLVYAFSFIDRSIINFLSPIIMEDMKLEAWQMGLLKGMAFALFYSIIGLPIAWLADRYNRVNILAASLAAWSLFTIFTGKATNFMQIGLARMGVGIGEAGGSPPAHSMISDLYPKEQRASALSIYSLGIPLGLMFAYFITGLVVGNPNPGPESSRVWRELLLYLGIAGIALAIILRMVVREPKRGAQDSLKQDDVEQEPFFKALKQLMTIPSWWSMCLGISFASFVGYAFSAWQMDYLLPFDKASGSDWGFRKMMYALAIINGIAYGGGTYLGGVIAEKFAKKSVRAYGLVPAITVLCAMPFAIASFWASTVMGHMVFITIFVVFLGMYLGPVFSVAQTLAPPNMRAMSTAAFFLILNIIALGGGPTVVGFMISAMKGPQCEAMTPCMIEPTRISITIVCFLFLLSAFFFMYAAKHLPKDWEDAQRRNEGLA